MSDSIVERVAKAICRARGVNPDSPAPAIRNEYDDGRPEADVATPAWMQHIAAAQAAIDEMNKVRVIDLSPLGVDK